METIANILATILHEKRMAMATRESSERLHLAVAAQNQVIWDWDLLTDEMWWSEAIETVFGYKKEETTSSSQFKHSKIHQDDRNEVLKGLKACIGNREKNWSDMYRFAGADGSYVNVRDTGLVMYNEGGTAIRMVGGMTEITKWKRKK